MKPSLMRLLDPSDFTMPYCVKCGHYTMLSRFRRRDTGSYMNAYYCPGCHHIDDKADWRKP